MSLHATAVLNLNVSASKESSVIQMLIKSAMLCLKRDLGGHAALTNFKRQSHSVMLTELGKFPVRLYLTGSKPVHF